MSNNNGNGRAWRLMGWALAVVVAAAAIRFVVFTLSDDDFMEAAEKLHEFVEERRHDRLMRDLKRGVDVP